MGNQESGPGRETFPIRPGCKPGKPEPGRNEEGTVSVASTQPARNARLLRPDFSVAERAREAAAIVAAPGYGRITALACRHHISRQSASNLVHRVEQAALQAVSPQPAGRSPLQRTITVNRERIRDTVVALAVEGRAANAGTQACLQTAFGTHVSAGKISGILKDAAGQAVEQMSAWPMPAAPLHTALDEIYDHGVPILTAIEDEHLGVLLTSKEQHADADTWGVRLLELRDRGLQFAQVVKDQGTAMAAGLVAAQVTAPVETDHFHFLRTFGREARHLAHQATRAQEHADKLEAALAYQTAPSRGRGRPYRPTTIEAYESALATAASSAPPPPKPNWTPWPRSSVTSARPPTPWPPLSPPPPPACIPSARPWPSGTPTSVAAMGPNWSSSSAGPGPIAGSCAYACPALSRSSVSAGLCMSRWPSSRKSGTPCATPTYYPANATH